MFDDEDDEDEGRFGSPDDDFEYAPLPEPVRTAKPTKTTRKRGTVVPLSIQESFRVTSEEREKLRKEMIDYNELAAMEGRPRFRSMAFFYRAKVGLEGMG